ncbi:MAG TPA: class I SAM-dependent methyltransferase [Planctomycetota bacterium]|jgi:SAM-dependent methyltransferase/uncharacterized protein YbaR (Trm112 family)
MIWRRQNLAAALVCPDCRKPLIGTEAGATPEAPTVLRCEQCSHSFSTESGAIKLWPPSRMADLAARVSGFQQPHAGVRSNWLLRALLAPNPICDPDGKRRNARVKAALSQGLVVNLGSKAMDWGEHIVSLDLVAPADGATDAAERPFAPPHPCQHARSTDESAPNERRAHIRGTTIDVLADIERLPFADGSVDGVICTYVLEHVGDAQACIAEIQRVVKPGGQVYVTVPFLFPTHPDPLDRWRWTLDGLRFSFQPFEEIEAGSSGGPFSAIVSSLPTQLASMFSNFYLFNIVRGVLGWLLWPVKFLDYLAWRSKRAYMAPANFFFWGRKRGA